MPVLAAAEDTAADRSARARLWRVFDPTEDAPEVPLTLLTEAQLHDLIVNGVTVVYRH